MRVISSVLAILSYVFFNDAGRLSAESTLQAAALRNADRPSIVRELKRIKSAVESNNKERVASLFEFPVPDSVCNPYIDSEKFDIEYQENGNKMTRTMFINYYKEISASLRIRDLKNLFSRINLNELYQKDSVGYKKVIETQPCYRMYRVEIKGDEVTLYTGSTWNENYKDKTKPAQKDAKYYNESCAHTTWWRFKLEGSRLRLVNIGEVG